MLPREKNTEQKGHKTLAADSLASKDAVTIPSILPETPEDWRSNTAHALMGAIYKVCLKRLPEYLSEIVYTVIRSYNPLFRDEILLLQHFF